MFASFLTFNPEPYHFGLAIVCGIDAILEMDVLRASVHHQGRRLLVGTTPPTLEKIIIVTESTTDEFGTFNTLQIAWSIVEMNIKPVQKRCEVSVS
jgi:hypothetical protein